MHMHIHSQAVCYY